MNNKPLEREPMNNEPFERKPIDRMRARLEALLKANAAPQATAGGWSKMSDEPLVRERDARANRLEVNRTARQLRPFYGARWSAICALMSP